MKKNKFLLLIVIILVNSKICFSFKADSTIYYKGAFTIGIFNNFHIIFSESKIVSYSYGYTPRINFSVHPKYFIGIEYMHYNWYQDKIKTNYFRYFGLTNKFIWYVNKKNNYANSYIEFSYLNGKYNEIMFTENFNAISFGGGLNFRFRKKELKKFSIDLIIRKNIFISNSIRINQFYPREAKIGISYLIR